MGVSDDYIRSRRSPGSTRHPTSDRKGLVVDILSGKKTPQTAQLRPAHSGESPCLNCEHFEFPGQPDGPCSIVAGVVKEQDTCDLLQERPGPDSQVQSQEEGP